MTVVYADSPAFTASTSPDLDALAERADCFKILFMFAGSEQLTKETSRVALSISYGDIYIFLYLYRTEIYI